MDISEPTLLLSADICKANIKRMAAKAQSHGLHFKPHIKTHQSAEIGHWLAGAGVEGVTVSSLRMAEYFQKHGWDDITIAFPCNVQKAGQIDDLAAKSSLTLLINNISTAQKLDAELSHSVQAYIEIDTGSGRTGLKTSEIPTIKKLISVLKSTANISWIGFYSHPGHSYSARSEQEIHEIHRSVTDQCTRLREELAPEFESFEICVGDTPCCSKAEQFESIDAISPGNFVFYDLMQQQIGSCKIRDIAVAMACPIVDRYPKRNELAIHGGAVHFSKEFLQEQDLSHYGKIASFDGKHWLVRDDNSCLKTLSQEHGIVRCSENLFNEYQIGGPISILPVHSCLTANLMESYMTTNGKIISQF